jgi:putative transcriptional regulator
MARVTNDDFAARLLRSAEQAVAIRRGEQEPARTTRRKVTTRTAGVEEAPRYTPTRITGLRKELGVSQPVLAGLVGVRPVTVKAWEQGQKEPSGAARRLLQILEMQPAAVIAAARVKDAGVGPASGAFGTRTPSAEEKTGARKAGAREPATLPEGAPPRSNGVRRGTR